MSSIVSKLVSIEDIIQERRQYNIPRYQRLYVWQDEQVNTLLEDIFEAWQNRKRLFYLGGILIVKHQANHLIYDLIDGQQRFTTLWLLGNELGGELKPFTKIRDKLRLRFSIREEATAYFENALNSTEQVHVKVSKGNSSLHKIINSRAIIQKFIQERLKNDKEEKLALAKFIKENVKLIVSDVPEHTDLNKLFEVINNRGLQLQHHDILKSRILSKIISNKKERIRYGKIWSACADMENYIEKNIRLQVGRNISSAYDDEYEIIDIDEILDLLKEKPEGRNKSLNLTTILDNKKIDDDDEDEESNEVSEEDPYEQTNEFKIRSILTFPQLLLHTLRIYLFKEGKKDIHRINEKELLSTFSAFAKFDDEQKAKSFIRLLWEVRVAFDLNIIKWVENGNEEEVHQIKPLDKYNLPRKHTYYLRRLEPKGSDGFALLQSMLYHSQQIITHYWLTPILYKCLMTANREELYSYLRKLDSFLFCTPAKDSLPERTWKLIGKDLDDVPLPYDISLLDEELGVDFPHYWFYKLDFVLWFLLKDKMGGSWKDYRITAKNSVEHVSPRKPRQNDKYQLSKSKLDDFGNLVLVSRGINSEYGNNIYTTKRSDFLSKLVPDSLKSALIFQNTTWSDALCDKHREQMKLYLKEYFEDETE